MSKESKIFVISIVIVEISNFFASFWANCILCGLDSFSGIIIPKTFFEPKALTHNAATTDESSPPLNPITTPFFLKFS